MLGFRDSTTRLRRGSHRRPDLTDLPAVLPERWRHRPGHPRPDRHPRDRGGEERSSGSTSRCSSASVTGCPAPCRATSVLVVHRPAGGRSSAAPRGDPVAGRRRDGAHRRRRRRARRRRGDAPRLGRPGGAGAGRARLRRPGLPGRAGPGPGLRDRPGWFEPTGYTVRRVTGEAGSRRSHCRSSHWHSAASRACRPDPRLDDRRAPTRLRAHAAQSRSLRAARRLKHVLRNAARPGPDRAGGPVHRPDRRCRDRREDLRAPRARADRSRRPPARATSRWSWAMVLVWPSSSSCVNLLVDLLQGWLNPKVRLS